ncbi:P-II family nitrogen regulator [Myxosarcina sp. GI1(2024)]
MKKVAAIIHSHKLDDVKLALVNAGVIGMTISEIKNFGRQKGSVTRYRGQKSPNEFTSKISIEVVIEDREVDLVVREISLAARTGVVGDGKIFVSPVSEIIRIRTNETGTAAI